MLDLPISLKSRKALFVVLQDTIFHLKTLKNPCFEVEIVFFFKGEPVELGDSFWTDSTCTQKCTCTRAGLQCSNEPCSFSQICQTTSFQYSCQTVPRRTCTISGDPHYYTFDNKVFHFQGTCTYVLSEQCQYGLPYYRVEGKNEHRGSTRVSWTRLVKVFVYNETIELVKGHNGEVNGNFAATPFSLRNGTIQLYESGFSVIISTNFGLMVSYDTYSYVRISVPYTYQNATCGLCGNFNNHPGDDFRTREGEVVSSDVVFANSWQASDDNDPSCEAQCGGLACASCTAAQTLLYSNTAHCGILQSSYGPFAACHQVIPPLTFVDSCVYDLCVGGGYQPILCQALHVYASQCQQNGIQPQPWRSPGFCEIPCPANSHFESQGTGCPATCVNPNSTNNCPLPDQESCVCNSGYVLSGGNCVPFADCGCSFEGQYYRSGETVILDEDCGRRCSCSSGSMTCSPHSCGPHETCRVEDGERGCRPNSYATCWIRGSGSYQTFDGLTYQYPGACRLTLAKVIGSSDQPRFMVTAEKVPRGQQGFISLLKIEAGGSLVTIEMGSSSTVQVIKIKFKIYFLVYLKPVCFEICSGSNQIRIYHSNIHSVILRTTFGLTVQTVWPHFVRVTVPAVYSSSLGGLCGNYNGHPHDDFRTPSGVLVNTSQVFGDSWRDGSLAAHCEENFNHNLTNNYNSSEFCGILSSENGPFTPCWAAVDPEQQVDVCVDILRASTNPASALCEVLRDYALMCQQNGVTLGQWRNAAGCALTCPSNSHYELCGTSCPSTCPSLSFPFTCDTQCQDGCQCNNGFVLNGNQCVPPRSCGCYHQGRYRQDGEQYLVGEECQNLCMCNGTTGAVQCFPSSCGPQESCRVVGGEFGCHPNPHGTCSASGDPHYLTFDGKAFDFQGTCRYVLATVCNDTDELHSFSVEAKNEPLNGLPVSITAEVLVNIVDYHVGKTCGLCGNFNGNPNDDFHTPSGTTVTSPDIFGTSWKVPGNYSCSDGCGSSCPQCTDDQAARAQCEVIQAADGPFSFCHEEVDPAPYFSDCVFDVCVSGNQGHNLLCRALETYVSACQSANVQIYPWRQNMTCRLDCPATSHYELCGTDCGHTCTNNTDATCEQVCSEGCFCDDGFVRSGTRCVSVESCGCQFDGFYYNAGESFWTESCSQKCECHGRHDLRCTPASCTPTEECTIRNGQLGCECQGLNDLHCTPASCTPAQECTIRNGQLGCYDAMSTCTVMGDPHYFTFDGALAHFQGTCSYIITKRLRNNNNETQFSVVATNSHRGNNRVSFVSSVDIYLSNQSDNVHVNGAEESLPTSAGSFGQVTRQGSYIVFDAVDFIVQFDGRSTLLVRMGQHYQNRVTGMCGNFNGDPTDDKVLPNGTLTQNDNHFGNNETPIRSGDGLNDCRFIEEYTELCRVITNTSGPFSSCHLYSNPQPFFTSCVYDLCLYTPANGMLCSAVSAYERTCSVLALKIPNWRSALLCVYLFAQPHLSPMTTAGYIRKDNDCVKTVKEKICEPVQLDDSFWTDSTCTQKCTCTRAGLQCSIEPCSFSQICRPTSFQYSCQTVQRRTCTISGDPHYYTFDNKVFHFQGTCTYVLSEQCQYGLPYYRVEGKNEHRGSTRVSWTRLVKVFVYNETIELVKDRHGEAKVNGNFAATPFSLRNGTIQVYESGFSVIVSTDFGLTVSYDTYSYVRISVPYTYLNATCGLCGNFNNHPGDDFRTREGEVVSSDVVFANSWQASGDDDPDCETECGGQDCSACTEAHRTLYHNNDHCGILQSVSGPFAACHQQLPVQNFVDSCVFDLCVGGGYQPILCQALNVYASQCQQNGIQPQPWRRFGFCEIPCPANSHFESQGTGCPATCVNHNSTYNCPLPDQESCICNSGYVLSGGVCVLQAECGCSFEGRYYRSGETVILDEDCGRQCRCRSGSMTCSPHSCGPHETCRVEDGERGCRPNSYATCWIRGSGSYQTFDGLTYQYPGACRLTLAKVMGLYDQPHFMVTAEKVPRGQQGFISLLKIEAGGSLLFIVLQVDGQLIRLPYSSGSNQIRIYHSNIHSVILRTTFGLTVQTVWPHFVRVTVPAVYSSSLGGLCGNYNGHPHDDFRTPSGILVNSSQVFGDSWRDGSLAAQCEETINHNSRLNYNSSEFCGILSSENGPFTPCWAAVDPEQQVDVCVDILRASTNPASALCEVLRDYALMCQQNGVTLGQWRNAAGCALNCPPNSHYELCGTSCPSTCPSLSFPFTCDTQCQDGCQCNNGFVLNGNQCVPPTSCGCYHQGRYRQDGEQFLVGEECQNLCMCNGTTGAVQCFPSSCGPQESCRVVGGEFGCHPNPHGTCSASGDPHYLTFDRKAFDFQGTCRYVLATVCNDTDELHSFSVEAKNEPWFGFPVSITAEVFVHVFDYHVRMSRDNNGLVEVSLFHF
uniref:VWFD domain-containing protein n=1 Tax=Kryptolebias marmoratus TaxID=37003 RepID=A0A3Q3BEZ5_KRYMA